MKALIITLAVLAALMLLLFIPVRIVFIFDADGIKNKTDAILKYGFIKIRLYPKKNKQTDKTEEADKTEENKPDKPFSYENKSADIKRYIKIFEIVKPDAAKILKRLANRAMIFEMIEVKSEFGFENAMHTGIFTGIYNGFVYSVLGFIHHNSNLRKMEVELQPVFEKTCFTVHLTCILRLKPVHIIIIAVSVLKLLRKIKKEGSR